MNGDAANTKTSTLTVVANIPNPTKSTLTATSPVEIDVAKIYSMQVFDTYLNPVKVLQTILVVITGVTQQTSNANPSNLYFTAAVNTLALGKYDLTFTIPSGVSSSRCGLYSYSAYYLL